ncbi:ABC transporter permease [Paenirhodobacter populi]|uniref:ABC transporter permease n=1 Tax=Paenirhodobacter populi TaxID=2306993 RepID=A0A443K2W9_9RHOB|nr:ABC transporter permease [Sinirhodobacter populi]RWR08290.1 ABC transporter permease [Sinirhodobacter populi]RWR14438.1 ABC transporter permease [Sinirhodobacter populi]RWR22101.1 ABC transporter permease [Sinirhodobacter populi]RWR27107.1 ABC transporter permease [Sinirhodobacter populi]
MTMTRTLPLSPRRQMAQRALRHRGLILSGAVLLAIVLIAILAPVIAPHDPYRQSLVTRLRPPVWLGGTWQYPLGTDALGRDMLSRLIYGARVSLMIGLISAGVSMVIGTVLGISAGYFGGRVDSFVQYLINVRLAMPVILVALAAVSLLGGSLLIVTMVMGLLLWDRFAVVLRAATMQVRSMEYIAAADMLGATQPRILWKDVLPNVMSHLIVILTLEMAHAIILEAGLSFLGLGVQPPTPSWGLMISEGKELLLFDSWLIMIPGVALFLLVFSINMFGDGIRDVTAPEGRN